MEKIDLKFSFETLLQFSICRNCVHFESCKRESVDFMNELKNLFDNENVKEFVESKRGVRYIDCIYFEKNCFDNGR